jgi:NAD(P)-dependent dehydrogenase (short-subunit alcohol dehydrogenase family)
MTTSNPCVNSLTADRVLAGVDLSRKRFVVTRCDSELGSATMNALVANGAGVFGLAQNIENAEAACRNAGPSATPVACDPANFGSISEAVQTIRKFASPLDAIIADATEIESAFQTDYLATFTLVNLLTDAVRDNTGRIVIVSGDASATASRVDGIASDKLDARQFHERFLLLGRANLAFGLYAKELGRRLMSRGIAVNTSYPGDTASRSPRSRLSSGMALLQPFLRVFKRSAAKAAATQVMLAASPIVAGITGEYWSNCRVTRGNPLLTDSNLARRLWDFSESILRGNGAAGEIIQTR